jgi:hypothetical protein
MTTNQTFRRASFTINHWRNQRDSARVHWAFHRTEACAE